MQKILWGSIVCSIVSLKSMAAVEEKPFFYTKPQGIKKIEPRKVLSPAAGSGTTILFDIPITYNDKVKHWIEYYQTSGKRHFTNWLEKSQVYIPRIQTIFKERGLPQDLAYLAMIESGLSPFAVSTAKAVGYWQFIKPTAERYGLKINWWLDERKDLYKSTHAAARYLADMHKMFGNWYLTAAGYNTGEGRIKRLMLKHDTDSFWEISEKALVQETKDYVPKLIAAILIAKAPSLYGFRNLNYKEPIAYEHFWAPGGTKISELAKYLNFPEKQLKYLNPELIKGQIPDSVSGHRIRIPKGSLTRVSAYFKSK